jgi:DNA-binding transcriptional regulator YhcF (GntR family)
VYYGVSTEKQGGDMMEFKNHIPIYTQIVDLIKFDFVAGELKPGDKLDSVRDYALKLKVNPNTVQKAYQEIERLGLAESKRGLGTFMTEDITVRDSVLEELAIAYTAEYILNMRNLGYGTNQIFEQLRNKLS